MQTKTFVACVFKGALLALICCLIGTLIFALVVKFTALGQSTIKIVNQILKVIAVFIGCFFSVKGSLGIVKGAISGALCTILLYAVFAIISGAGFFSIEMLADLLFTAIVGGISGIVAVNVRGKE